MEDAGVVIAYGLEPHGVRFLTPVTIGFDLSAEQIFSFSLPWHLSGDGLEPLDRIRVDVDVSTGIGTVSGELTHFSQIIFFQTREPERPRAPAPSHDHIYSFGARGEFRFFSWNIGEPLGDRARGETFPVQVRTLRIRESHRVAGSVEERRYPPYFPWETEDRVYGAYDFVITTTLLAPWHLSGEFAGGGPVLPLTISTEPPRATVTGDSHTAVGMFTCIEVGVGRISYSAEIEQNLRVVAINRYTSGPQAGSTEERETEHSAEASYFVALPYRCTDAEPPPAVAVPSDGDRVEAGRDLLGPLEAEATVEVLVLVIDGEHYPAEQFITALPDACDAEHYHGPVVRSLEGTIRRDPNPPGCGHGLTSEIPHATVPWPQHQYEEFHEWKRANP